MKIITNHKPLDNYKDNSMDWYVYDEEEIIANPINFTMGYGATEKDAVANFMHKKINKLLDTIPYFNKSEEPPK